MPKKTKPESKRVLESLFPVWARELSPQELKDPSYSRFKTWAEKRGYGDYFKFRSVGGPDDAIEWWFAQYFKQTWRY